MPTKRNFVGPCRGQDVPLIVVGTGVVGVKVGGVHKVAVGRIGGVIERVAVGVRDVEREGPGGLAQRKLQRVVVRVGLGVDPLNRSEPG